MPSSLRLYFQAAGAAVQRLLGYFQMPEPYLLDVHISVCIMVAWRVFFEAINQHACGESYVPGKERAWEKFPCPVQGITPTRYPHLLGKTTLTGSPWKEGPAAVAGSLEGFSAALNGLL